MSIHNDDSVDKVGDYETAHCPECDARYGAHRDGDCPQCGTAMEFGTDYVALVIAGYEGVVAVLAREHAPSQSTQFAVCAACVENTPLALENASDVPKADRVENVIADAESAIATLGRDDTWVHGELADAYTDAFREACADPADCMVCRDAANDDDIECGHSRHGEPCPHPDANAA